MQQLHPKAVWLFLFQFFFGFLILGFFSGPFIFPIVMVTGLIKSSFVSLFIIILLTLLLPLILLCYFLAKSAYRYWHYELTENALRIEKGIIWKKYISIPYERIQNVDISRGVLDRILGLSDLQIQTAGSSAVYGRPGGWNSEGKLPGLDIKTAEQLREELVNKSKGSKQGL